MKTFLLYSLVAPFLVATTAVVVIYAVLIAAAFVTWDTSVITTATRNIFGSLSWTKVRFLWLSILVASWLVYAVTERH